MLLSGCRPAVFSQVETAAFDAMWDSDQFCGIVDARWQALSSPFVNRPVRTCDVYGCSSREAVGPLGLHYWLSRGHTSSHACFAFAKVAPIVVVAFVLGLQTLIGGGLVQLESDELLSDVDAVIDLHSGKAQ